MAALLSLPDFSSLGRHILLGASIGLGIGIGIGAGMVVSRRYFFVKAQDQNIVVCLTELTDEMKELRSVIVKLEFSLSETRTKRVPLKDHSSVHASDEETEEDEFYEMSGEELPPSAIDTGQPKEIIDQVDGLHPNREDKQKIHRLVQDGLQQYPQSAELAWRYARSFYDIGLLKGKSGDKESKKTLLLEGLTKAEKAISLDSNCANAYKWYAIILGSTTEYESLQNQIVLGFKYKEHILKAIDLNKTDPSSYHLLGRWCYEIAMLSWWQRKAASTFVAEPPTSTIEEALENFLKAEEIEPGFWLSNSYWIGKCYHQQGDQTQTTKWLKKALSLPVSSDDDKESYDEAQKLLSSI